MRACVKDNMGAAHYYLRVLFTRKNGRVFFGSVSFAYMDVGKVREQDAEALHEQKK